MICGAADEGSAALFVCGGSQILGLEDGRSGLDLPGGQIGVRLLRGRGECVGGREEGLDLPGGQIGVRLLCVEGERGWIRPEGESA